MTMKLPVDEMKIGEKYWLDDLEDIYGELVEVEPNIIWFSIKQPQEVYLTDDQNGLIPFLNSEKLYKPLN